MTEQNPTVDGRTKRAADIALAKRTISRASYDALLAGTLSLQRAKELGRSGTPTNTSEGTSGPGRGQETPGRPCLCGCGGTPKGKKSLFLVGHDARLHGELKRQLRSDPLVRSDKFNDAQRRYAVERGLAGPEVLPGGDRDG